MPDLSLPSVPEQIATTEEINRRIRDARTQWTPTKTLPTEPGWYPTQVAHTEWCYEEVKSIDGCLCIYFTSLRKFLPVSHLSPDILWGPKAWLPTLEVEILQEEMELE